MGEEEEVGVLPYWKPPFKDLKPCGNIGYLTTAPTRGGMGNTDPSKHETYLSITRTPVTNRLTLFHTGKGNDHLNSFAVFIIIETEKTYFA